MTILIFFSCLFTNLNGDSVHPYDPDLDEPSSGDGSGLDEDGGNSGGAPEGGPGIDALSFSEAVTETVPNPDNNLYVETRDGGWDVFHTNIALACDMSAYETEISMSEGTISVDYMPIDDDRGCMYDVQFVIVYDFPAGEYTLSVMEDTIDVVVE